jgi:hypothetical protein
MAKKEPQGIFFERIDRFGRPVKYPAWRYHALYEPKIVNDTAEDQVASDQGWKDPQAPVTALQGFNNFYHDLEDFNNAQLVYYAKAEYGIELPVEAPKAKLLWAIWRIAIEHPKSKGRVILLAQSIRMNYDETVKRIQQMAGDIYACDEVTREEIEC